MWLAGLPGEGSAYDMIEVPGWEVPPLVWKTVLASVIMDVILAGSEVFHRVKLHFTRNNPDSQEAAGEEEGILKNGAGQQYQYQHQTAGTAQHQL